MHSLYCIVLVYSTLCPPLLLLPCYTLPSKGPIRNSLCNYISLGLSSLKTELFSRSEHLPYSFATRRLLQSRAKGREDKRCVDKPLTTSCRDVWWARKCHVIKHPTGSFHSHNFQVILGFLLSGQLPR